MHRVPRARHRDDLLRGEAPGQLLGDDVEYAGVANWRIVRNGWVGGTGYSGET